MKKMRKLPRRSELQRRGPQESPGSKSPVAEVTFEFPLPPSTNKLYTKRRGGGLALSADAKAYRTEVQSLMSQHLASITSFPVTPDLVYEFGLTLYFEALENPGWFEIWERDVFYTRDAHYPKKHKKAGQVQFKKGTLKHRKGERKAKTRYKKIDYDNRIKFVQDCVANFLGVDDSQIFRGRPEKRESPHRPRAVVCVKVLDRDQFFEERRSDG